MPKKVAQLSPAELDAFATAKRDWDAARQRLFKAQKDEADEQMLINALIIQARRKYDLRENDAINTDTGEVTRPGEEEDATLAE